MSTQSVNVKRLLKRIPTTALLGAWLVIGVPTQFILAVLCCFLFPEKLGESLAVMSPFGLGVLNYFICKQLTKRRAIHEEASRWLVERSRRTPQRRARIHLSKQIGVWIPVVFVTFAFLFLPELFGVATHFLFSKPARFGGYEIHRPITWMVFDARLPGDQESPYADGFGFKGPLRSRFKGFLGLYPAASTMSFRASSSNEDLSPHSGKTIAIRTLSIPIGSISCREYVDTHPQHMLAVDCVSATGLFASFYGDPGSVSDFYRTLETIRPKRASDR